jgi:hypothetical protein
MPFDTPGYMMSVLGVARAMALSKLLQVRECFAGFNRESQWKPVALVRNSLSNSTTKSIIGKWCVQIYQLVMEPSGRKYV